MYVPYNDGSDVTFDSRAFVDTEFFTHSDSRNNPEVWHILYGTPI